MPGQFWSPPRFPCLAPDEDSVKSTPVHLYMTHRVHCVRPDTSLARARTLLVDHGVSCLAVTDDSARLLGVLSRTDVLALARPHQSTVAPAVDIATDIRVEDAMTPAPMTVTRDDSLAFAARCMVHGPYHRVFVADGESLEGVLSTRDIMLAMRERRVTDRVGDFLTSPVFTVGTDEPMSEGLSLLRRAHVSGLVVTEAGWPVGIFTQKEALDAGTLPRDTPLERVMNPAVACVPPTLSLFRAAEKACVMQVRRVVVVADGEIEGVVTGLDFARAAMR